MAEVVLLNVFKIWFPTSLLESGKWNFFSPVICILSWHEYVWGFKKSCSSLLVHHLPPQQYRWSNLQVFTAVVKVLIGGDFREFQSGLEGTLKDSLARSNLCGSSRNYNVFTFASPSVLSFVNYMLTIVVQCWWSVNEWNF